MVDAVENPRILSVVDEEIPRLVDPGSAFLATIAFGSEQDHLTRLWMRVANRLPRPSTREKGDRLPYLTVL
jgi:hypothetical protein